MAESTKVQPTSPSKQEATALEGSCESLPVPGSLGAVWDRLHASIGNRAVGRLIESQRAASNETPTRVSAQLQAQIESNRAGGIALEGAPGVRLHYGDNAQALARGLNARAFTQGSDIFFGESYDPESEAGRITMAHELTHVSQGRATTGTVQRDGPPVQPDPLPPDLSGA